MSEKYCVLPGQAPVRLSSIHGGHTVIIGEEPREIPEIFEKEALAKGCFTETMIAALQTRLGNQGTTNGESNADEGKGPDRAEQIKTACIEIINAGNAQEMTGGKPKLDVLKAKLGFDVTGAERDAACI